MKQEDYFAYNMAKTLSHEAFKNRETAEARIFQYEQQHKLIADKVKDKSEKLEKAKKKKKTKNHLQLVAEAEHILNQDQGSLVKLEEEMKKEMPGLKERSEKYQRLEDFFEEKRNKILMDFYGVDFS